MQGTENINDYDLDSESEYSLTGIDDDDDVNTNTNNFNDEDQNKHKLFDKLKSDPLFKALQEQTETEFESNPEQIEQLTILTELTDKIKLSEQNVNKKEIIRNINDPIAIHDGWEWKFDHEKFKHEYYGMTFDDIGKLCDSRLIFIRNKIDIISFFDVHSGVQKGIYLVEKRTGTNFFILGEESGEIYFEINDKQAHLLYNNEMNDAMEQLKQCKTEDEFDNYIQYIFDKDYVRQCALVILYAYNVSIWKSKKNLISYMKTNNCNQNQA